MDISLALRRRDRAVSNLRDLYSRAEHFGLLSSQINDEYNVILANLGKAPQWVRQYLDGYRAALTEQAYRQQLVYGAIIDGHFFSTHRDREDYYEKSGIEPRAFADDNPTKGHYWRNNLKPFFVSI
jgi:hypothetical protein